MLGRDLAIVIACYGQPQMMRAQERYWSTYPKPLAERLEIVVVDDHGDPEYTGVGVEGPFEFAVYRVDKDIPWNQMGARNLGMKQATAPWRLMLDPDMLLTAANLARIFEFLPLFRGGHHYKPKLVPLAKPYGSPNLYICHEKDFWRAGGYNEDFAGAKGYSDVVLHRCLAEMSKRHHLDSVFLEFIKTEDIPDAAVAVSCGVDRDLKVNSKKFQDAVRFAGRNGWKMYAQGVKNHVRFPWHRVR